MKGPMRPDMKNIGRRLLMCLIGGLAAAFILYRVLYVLPEEFRAGGAERLPGDLLIAHVLALFRQTSNYQRCLVVWTLGFILVILMLPEPKDPKKG